VESEAEAVVITPTLNERENIALHIRDVFQAVPQVSMLVVDDGSRDGTIDEIEALRSTPYPRLHLLMRKGPPSFAASYRDGVQWALQNDFRFLISMDADRSHPATTIPALLRAAESCDLVVASRYVRGVSVRNWPLRRVLLSAMANAYARVVTSLPCSDLTSGFCLYRAEIVRDAVAGNLFTSGYAFLIEMKYRAWRAGARLYEVPYTFVERRLGTSKMSGRRLLEGIVSPILCRVLLGRPDAEVRSRPTGRDET
jgi:dolichol-phosphate mannosyltransferase